MLQYIAKYVAIEDECTILEERVITKACASSFLKHRLKLSDC